MIKSPKANDFRPQKICRVFFTVGFHQNYIEWTHCILSPPHICPSLSRQYFKQKSHKSVQTLMRTYYCKLCHNDKAINNVAGKDLQDICQKTWELETQECLFILKKCRL